MENGAPLAESEPFEDLLGSAIEPLGITLSEAQVQRLRDHYELLCRWNARINLTSVRTLRDVVTRHFAESLFLADRLPNVGTVVDVGSGAGFPGVPISVARPGLKVTLVDSNGKKAAFLQEAVRGESGVKVRSVRFSEVEGEYNWGVWRGVALEDIEEDLPSRVQRVAAITSSRVVSAWPANSCVNWTERHEIPWDRRRVVVLGECVSRGT